MDIPPPEEKSAAWEEVCWDRTEPVKCAHCGEQFVRESLNQEECVECGGWLEAEQVTVRRSAPRRLLPALERGKG